jgi:3',5'-cyclic AMP phosphodiesterase CpdA
VRIVQLSDTHLSARFGVSARNLERVAAYVNERVRPDLIVHTGDVIALSPDSMEDREFALDAHRIFDAPVRYLPGNHDVGEGATQRPWMGFGITSRRLALHRKVFGDDRFVERAGAWTLVGLNSGLLGCRLPEEDEQWAWLEEVLASTPPSSSVLLFLHQPLWSPEGAHAGEDVTAVPEVARQRLRSLRGAHRIHAVGSGHLHRYVRRVRSDILEVWAPSTAFLGNAGVGLGVVEWRLSRSWTCAHVCSPPGLEEHELAALPELVAMIDELSRGAALTARESVRPARASPSRPRAARP